jgi:AP-3 complex subunit beta
VRLLHTNREAQHVALMNIATIAATHPRIFAEHVAEFFVCGGESLATRSLKLEILTLLANEQNITRILREMREYTKDEDKTFVAAAIQAIGRCAAAIPEVAESCMQ